MEMTDVESGIRTKAAAIANVAAAVAIPVGHLFRFGYFLDAGRIVRLGCRLWRWI